MKSMRLLEYLQTHTATVLLGGLPPSPDDDAYEDLQRVQRTNELYFKSYWATLIVSFLVTFTVALVYRDEMGGLAAVLGAGGVVQGGLLLRLSSEWKEKARIDIVAVLSRRLSPDQLQVVLKDILEQLRK